MPVPLTSRRWFLPAMVFAGWTVVALVSAGLAYGNWQTERLNVELWRAVLLTAPFWIYWPLVTPLVAWLDRRLPLERPPRAPALLAHAGLGALIIAAHVTFYLASYRLWWRWPAAERVPSLGSLMTGYLRSRWPFELLTWLAIVIGIMAVRFYRDGRERALREDRLEAQLAQSQLQALRMQLHPHFLFNTLQAISVLVVEQPRVAQRMLTLLGDLLRAVLDGDQRQEIPLREELAFLRRYLEIEQVRFPDRLAVRFEVDEAANDVPVPGFVLQPLVENAIRYAIAPRAERGELVIGARLLDGVLELTVSDDGPGFSFPVDEGVGLSTTRERLEKLYGGTRLALRNRLPTPPGAAVTLTIPLRA